jgi:UDP:flavonoid glycosyltransferase YjiC (YdhE family)
MKTLLFAPEAINLAETTRMIEIARACRGRFEAVFMSYGGLFEKLIEEEGFRLLRPEPRLTPEKMDHLNRVSKGEKLAFAFREGELRARLASEQALYDQLHPAAVLTGFCVSVPVSARIQGLPVVWTSQTTCLADSFRSGAAVPDRIRPRFLKGLLGALHYRLLVVHSDVVYLNLANRILREHGKKPFDDVFDFWQDRGTFLLEPPEFANLPAVPPNHHYIGPLVARLSRPVPPEVEAMTGQGPIVYFSMGSTARPDIVRKSLREFDGTPYKVIAPVKWYLEGTKERIPENVMVTDLLPAHEINRLADISVIHGGNGSVMNAALAGKPVVGVGMQFEQMANLEHLVRKGFAIRISKFRFSAKKLLQAVDLLLNDEDAKRKAREFKEVVERWDGPANAARILTDLFDPGASSPPT